MLSLTYEITTALSHTDELISPPYDIAIVTISYGRVTKLPVWDSMMSKKNMGWPFYAAVRWCISLTMFLLKMIPLHPIISVRTLTQCFHDAGCAGAQGFDMAGDRCNVYRSSCTVATWKCITLKLQEVCFNAMRYTKSPTYCRWHLQMYFLECKWWYAHSNSIKACSHGSSWWYVTIVSGKG